MSEEVVARPGDAIGRQRPRRPRRSTTIDVDEPDEPIEPAATAALARRTGSRASLGHVHPAMWLTLAGVVAFAAIFGTPRRAPPRALRLVVVRPRHLRPGLLAGVARRPDVHDRARPRLLGPAHQPRRPRSTRPSTGSAPDRRSSTSPRRSSSGSARCPSYLIARDRFDRPWVGLAFAVAFLMYAPIQWISWANYHPEALVITPFLFALVVRHAQAVGLVLRRSSASPWRPARTRRWPCSCSASCCWS